MNGHARLTWFCDRCSKPYRPLDRTQTHCIPCTNAARRHAVPLMNATEVQAAAKQACDTKPHNRPALRKAS